jgi:predicted PolB exonuclease-like 3'-5' exonuclease
MTSADARPGKATASTPKTSFLIVDTESVPDGDLIARVRYPGERLTPEAAIDRYRDECRAASPVGSDFIPVSFQTPVAVCVLRVGPRFELQKLSCLDAPEFRPAEVVRKFWLGVDIYRAQLVTFNGRGFDIPLLELAAFRQGINLSTHMQKTRHRYNGGLDLLEWFTNFGAYRVVGGLNLLAKMLGLPGKTDVDGSQVLELYRRGDLRAINDYCLCDTLDTYFVFLRTRVLTGDIDIDEEQKLHALACETLDAHAEEYPVVRTYLADWSAARQAAGEAIR